MISAISLRQKNKHQSITIRTTYIFLEIFIFIEGKYTI